MYYKVVKQHIDNGKIRSVITKYHTWCVQYQIGMPVKPSFPNSKLFIFNDLDAARAWIHGLWPEIWDYHQNYLAIYECDVENPIEATCRSSCTGDFDLAAFWSRMFTWVSDGKVKIDFNHSQWDSTVPKNTYWADSVTLTKFVEKFVEYQQFFSR